MSYLYVTALLGMAIPEKIKDPIRIGGDLYLTNNSSHFVKGIRPEQALAIGTLETNYLFNGNPVIYSRKATKGIDESHEDIVKFMRDCLAFLCSLWVVEDNSVNFELGFAISSKDGHVHSNSLTYHYWTCEGEKQEFTAEPERLKRIYDEFGEQFKGISVSDEPTYTMQRKEVGRIGLGLNFLQQARSTPDLGLKIANYCSLFEVLLSTTSVELTHQMAERAAFYLRDDPLERLEYYKKCKRSYAVRSKVVHGAFLSKKDIPDLQEIARHCDKVARELVIKYLNDEEFQSAIDDPSNEKLDTFFLKKIFGVKEEIA
ncbi:MULTISPECIES: HEPN domain-containing protein [Acinetobacter]|uniref:HEPN domain-containing protein n=1 Tax=Acinetobacter TaxID=469 RepID=UPI0025950613|nr:HEPN domain-containing protein [Acinetobacter pittii]MDN4022372.1 HEPN domain-containing protein [Acinetobacter pittii]